MVAKYIDFIIRPYSGTHTELEAIFEVYRQCEDFLALGPVPVASMKMVLADLELSKKEGCTFCLICSASSGEVLGVVDYTLAGWAGKPDTAYMELLMIAAPYRSQGLGEAVVRAVEDQIRTDGRAHSLEAGVQVNNPGAIRFWQRMGFQIISGAEPLQDGTVAYRLWKSI
jgi:ribosomal protein S18 acetylase RimI-like enzyme